MKKKNLQFSFVKTFVLTFFPMEFFVGTYKGLNNLNYKKYQLIYNLFGDAKLQVSVSQR